MAKGMTLNDGQKLQPFPLFCMLDTQIVGQYYRRRLILFNPLNS